MGKIIDTGIVSEVKFPYISIQFLTAYYNPITYWSIKSSYNDTIDKSIWKPGTYVIGCLEESEGDYGYITAVSKEIYDAKINKDQEAWTRLRTVEWKKHLDNPKLIIQEGGFFKEICTDHQLSIIAIDETEYNKSVKLVNIGNDLANIILNCEDDNYHKLLNEITDMYNKYFSGVDK